MRIFPRKTKKSKYYRIVRDWWLEARSMKDVAKVVDYWTDILNKFGYPLPIEKIKLFIGTKETSWKDRSSHDGYTIHVPNNRNPNFIRVLCLAAYRRRWGLIFCSNRYLEQMIYEIQQWIRKNQGIRGRLHIANWFEISRSKDRKIDIQKPTILEEK